MKLSERLRRGENFYAESSLAFDEDLAAATEEAADALDAHEARIKVLEKALIVSVQAMEWMETEASQRLRFRDSERYPALCNALANVRAVMVIARAALEGK